LAVFFTVQDSWTAKTRPDGKKFKIVPERLLYSLQWLHNGTPPDFQLQLVRDLQFWLDAVSPALLAELSEHVPELRDLRTRKTHRERPGGAVRRSGRFQQMHERASCHHRVPSRAAAVRDLLRRGLAAGGAVLENASIKSGDYSLLTAPLVGPKSIE
jgi:hypothetical protein